MKVNKKVLRGQINKGREELNALQRVVDALPDDLPGNPCIHVVKWAVYMDIPYDWGLYKSIRKLLGGDWHSKDVHVMDDGKKFFILTLHGNYAECLYITLEPLQVGSDCRLEKVGERTVELFQAVCN